MRVLYVFAALFLPLGGLVGHWASARDDPATAEPQARSEPGPRSTEEGAFVVSVTQPPPDDGGSNVTNVFAFEVRPARQSDLAEYTIIYFVDRQLQEDFPGQTLPFQFQRDFRGRTPGKHEITIEIEDVDDRVLHAHTCVVEVLEVEQEGRGE
ncbi:hypothetical protein ACFL6M_03800 [Candidatus Eisenbacteria bacterium]|uniref:Uncharacterized protein n=1 Tax=Eiseniibacteriota bacterium TaxID=2212470 RepID=A0ABV6YK45_UNCEI